MGITYRIFLIALLWLWVPEALATSISVDFAHGADYESSTFSLDGEFGKPEKDEISYDWLGSFTKSKVNTQDNLGNQVIDNSYTFVGGLGLETPGRFSIGADYSYSITPEEAIISYGPSLSFGYSHFFSQEDEELSLEYKKPRFAPRLTIKLNLSNQTHDERFGTETRKGGSISRPTTGVNSIVQRSIGGSVSFRPIRLFRVRGSYTAYSYSRDVNGFLQYLDAQPRRVTGLSGSISGFPRYDFGFELDFYFGEGWEVALTERRSKIISDESTSKTDKVMVYLDITESFRLGVGGQRSVSDAGSNTVANEGLLSLAYDF